MILTVLGDNSSARVASRYGFGRVVFEQEL